MAKNSEQKLITVPQKELEIVLDLAERNLNQGRWLLREKRTNKNFGAMREAFISAMDTLNHLKELCGISND